MANSSVDRNESLMQKDFGTKVLITDRAADKYLQQLEEEDQKKFTQFCGGAGGWDDFCERMGE